MSHLYISLFFFFNDTATTEIYTLSLHDALPICCAARRTSPRPGTNARRCTTCSGATTSACATSDRKSTRLNSSHVRISYAVFCLKKKKKQPQLTSRLINSVVAKKNVSQNTHVRV